MTCFCFHLPPFSSFPVFPLFWDGPNYSPLMCGWTLWQYQEASHSLSLTHAPLQPFIMSLLCISDLNPFTSYYSSTNKADLPPLSLFLLSLFSLTTPSIHINLTLTGIYCSCISCLFCITVVNLLMRTSNPCITDHRICNEFK